MKLIKLTDEQYIIVDDSEIKEGDWFLNTIQGEVYCNNIPNYNVNKEYLKKITHSTQPLDSKGYWGKVMPLTLTIPEIKELIGEVDVEKHWEYFRIKNPNTVGGFKEQYISFLYGYNQAIEDNNEKKYTENQAKQIWKAGQEYWKTSGASITFEELTERMINQPKTEWEVEFENGKLKLK